MVATKQMPSFELPNKALEAVKKGEGEALDAVHGFVTTVNEAVPTAESTDIQTPDRTKLIDGFFEMVEGLFGSFWKMTEGLLEVTTEAVQRTVEVVGDAFAPEKTPAPKTTPKKTPTKKVKAA